VRLRDYENDRHVRGIWLESLISNKEHSLGAATNQFQVFSHYDACRPFLDAGFEPRIVQHARGGATFLGFLAHPGRTFDDTVRWDQYYEGLDTQANALMDRGPVIEQAVRIRSDLRRGHGVSISLGYFRIICLNGLVASVLNLGRMKVNHVNFSVAEVKAFLQANELPDPNSLPTAPTSLLEGVADLIVIDDPEKIQAQPRLMREPLRSITSAYSPKIRQALVEQMDRLREKQPQFSYVDLLNALTNTVAIARSPMVVYDEVDPAVRSLVDLVEIQAVREGVKAF
jgi:hypothetical protein